MKRVIVLLALTLMQTSFLYSQNLNFDPPNFNYKHINGGYTEIIIQDYVYKSGLWDSSSKVSYKIEYNSRGNVLCVGNGKYCNVIYKYDDKGREIEYVDYRAHCVERSGNVDSCIADKYIYRYDSNGNRIEMIQYRNSGSVFSKREYRYHSNGNKAEEIWYYSNGSVYITEKFDNKGNEIESVMYTFNGTIDQKLTIIIHYDDMGNRIESLEYNSQGLLSRKNVFKYNEKGNMIESIEYSADGQVNGKQTRKYNEKGFLIEAGFKDQHNNYIEIMTYDEMDNLIIYSKQDFLNGFKLSWKFKYDNYGNRIEAIVYNELNVPTKKTEYFYSK